MFGFFHPIIMTRWMWFVWVTDRTALDALKNTHPERFELIFQHLFCFAFYVLYRRLCWVQERLINGNEIQLIRIKQCKHVDPELVSAYKGRLLELHKINLQLVDFIMRIDLLFRENRISVIRLSRGPLVIHLDQLGMMIYKEGKGLFGMGEYIEWLDAHLQETDNTP